jgi:hypothetical protein
MFLAKHRLVVSFFAAALCVAAQTPDSQSAAAQAPPAPAEPKSYWSATKFGALVDININKNFNDPASGNAALQNFAIRANRPDLNYGEFYVDHEAAPFGFRVDIGAGRTARFLYATEKAPRAFEYIQQAYVSLKPPGAKGFQMDFGKFVTTAGAELIESNSNWNYSRSLLFAWAGP